MINWALMVGNDNTRWHWGTAEGTAEPAIPWDAWVFPDGTPVSFTETCAFRQYATGIDTFVRYEDFLPKSVTDAGDFTQPVAAGGAYIPTAPPAATPILDGIFEASVWASFPGDGNVSLVVRAQPNAETQEKRPLPVRAHPTTKGAAYKAKPATGAAAPLAMQSTRLAPPVSGEPSVSMGGYHVVLVGAAKQLLVMRNNPGTLLGTFDLSTLENGVRPQRESPPAGVCECPNLPLISMRLTIELTFHAPTTRLQFVVEAWNMMRVVVRTLPATPTVPDEAAEGALSAVEISVFFNPTLPETGFVGDSSDTARMPKSIPPRLVVRDPSPLPAGEFSITAGKRETQVDYMSVLPLSEL